jgi:hypothetical protein
MHNPQLIHIGATLHCELMVGAEQIRSAKHANFADFFYSLRFTYQRSIDRNTSSIGAT